MRGADQAIRRAWPFEEDLCCGLHVPGALGACLHWALTGSRASFVLDNIRRTHSPPQPSSFSQPDLGVWVSPRRRGRSASLFFSDFHPLTSRCDRPHRTATVPRPTTCAPCCDPSAAFCTTGRCSHAGLGLYYATRRTADWARLLDHVERLFWTCAGCWFLCFPLLLESFVVFFALALLFAAVLLV